LTITRYINKTTYRNVNHKPSHLDNEKLIATFGDSNKEVILNNKKFTITFSDSAKEFILNVFGKTIDAEGYIVDKRDGETRILTGDGEDIHISEFGGIVKWGSGRRYFKNDLVSIIGHCLED